MHETAGLHKGVVALVQARRLGQVQGDRIVLLDIDEPFSARRIPASIETVPHFKQGLDYLRQAKPLVVVLHSFHRGEGDLRRQVTEVPAYFRGCPVVGVEAPPAAPLNNRNLTLPATGGGWLGKFHEYQLPWCTENGVIALPCDPVAVDETQVPPGTHGPSRIAEINKLMSDLMAGTLELDPQVTSQLKYVAFALQQIYRAWGMVAQFGWWLRHPRIQHIMQGFTGRVPLTLGGMHEFEVRLLREFCGLDAVVLDTAHEAAGPSVEEMGFDRAAVELYEQLVRRHINDGIVYTRDMQEAFPF